MGEYAAITLAGEAVTAAAEAMEDAAVRWLGRDLGTIHRDDIAKEALTAALPLLVTAAHDPIVTELDRLRLVIRRAVVKLGDHDCGFSDARAAEAEEILRAALAAEPSGTGSHG